jgi:hypothetical protein
MPFRQSTPDALTGHQLNKTVRPFNLWIQVQNGSKFVDFTKIGAVRRYLWTLWRNSLKNDGKSFDLGVYGVVF